MVRVRITDPDATVQYPFRFKPEDRVRSKGSDSFSGTIVDAVFEGDMPGAFTVTYTVKKDDGALFMAMEPELAKLSKAETEQIPKT